VIIRTENLARVYEMGEEKVYALRGVNLEIEKGDYVAIMGPSGSGKSTLMNLIGCLDTPTSGEYWLNGTAVSELTDDQLAKVRNEEVGFVFQTFHLLPRYTALENVQLPLIYGNSLSAEARQERAIEALNQVDLGDRMAHRPNELSGGQRQRVAIARALVKHPTLVIADEPTASLDSHTADQVLALMRERGHAQGAAFLIATHDVRLLGRCDRVVALLDGRIADSQPLKETAA